ncbi:hypothetical protein BZA05DRAFT_224736 [Tricharina praecox]|uniref:uncharacterized protein n=1 Tax=Tricharina praecox TaxID=43433 RepID=UPI00221E70C9|nr:uncharacterized protein BZA05DRAFT_224736 [Tricharina praecox]KAI5856031.1 hypothetical protein BZA05DRAFT_224736 [Tricharina praecox]
MSCSSDVAIAYPKHYPSAPSSCGADNGSQVGCRTESDMQAMTYGSSNACSSLYTSQMQAGNHTNYNQSNYSHGSEVINTISCFFKNCNNELNINHWAVHCASHCSGPLDDSEETSRLFCNCGGTFENSWQSQFRHFFSSSSLEVRDGACGTSLLNRLKAKNIIREEDAEKQQSHMLTVFNRHRSIRRNARMAGAIPRSQHDLEHVGQWARYGDQFLTVRVTITDVGRGRKGIAALK